MTIVTHPREIAARPTSITVPATPPAVGVAWPLGTKTLSCLAAEIGRLLYSPRGRLDAADAMTAGTRPERLAGGRCRSDLFALPPVD